MVIMSRKLIVTLALTVGGAVAQAGGSSPLAASFWPIAHHDRHNSDSTPAAGPRRLDQTSQLALQHKLLLNVSRPLSLADPISLVGAGGTEADGIWGSSISSVFRLEADEGGDGDVSVASRIFRDINFEFHGAYALMHSDGSYYAATDTSVQRYSRDASAVHKSADDFGDALMTGEYFIPTVGGSGTWSGVSSSWKGRVSGIRIPMAQL